MPTDSTIKRPVYIDDISGDIRDANYDLIGDYWADPARTGEGIVCINLAPRAIELLRVLPNNCGCAAGCRLCESAIALVDEWDSALSAKDT